MHARGILECGIDPSHRPNQQQIDIWRVEQRQHEDDASDRVNIEKSDEPAVLAQHVLQDAGVRSYEIEPSNGADIGGQKERDQIENLEPFAANYIRARNDPGEDKAQQATEKLGADAGQDGVADRIQESAVSKQ